MIRCMNRECNNYKQELEDTLEICPLCGEETKKFDTKLDGRRKLVPVVSVGSIISIVVVALPFMFAFYLAVAMLLTCIVMSIIIRSKAAIITSILSAGLFCAVLSWYGYFDMLFG